MTSALAGELAAAGADVVALLIDQHGPDTAGRCRTCRKDGYAPAYPCPVADAAAAAAQLLDAGREP